MEINIINEYENTSVTDMTVFLGRNISELYLSNCSLYDKHIKMLALNPRIGILDLSCNYLTSKCAKWLSQMGCNSLDLSVNMIGNSGLRMLLKNKLLQRLYISENNITDAGVMYVYNNTTLLTLDISANLIKNIGAKFLSKNKHITSLNLSYNKIRNKGLNYFSKNSAITTFYVDGNFINEDTSLLKFTMNNTIKNLSICDNYLGNNNVILLSKMNLEELNISDNEFTTSGAISLAKNSGLLTLKLANNNIGDLGMYELLCNKHLGYIKLTCNMKSTFNNLISENLNKLTICNSVCNMNLMKFIEQNKSITQLKICDSIDIGLTHKMLKVLARNTTIRYLSLPYNNISCIDAYKNNNIIRSFNLEGNRLDIHSVKVLLTISKLETLNLSGNNMLDGEAYKLLSTYDNLRELSIICERFLPAYALYFIHNYTLTSLEFTIYTPLNDIMVSNKLLEQICDRINTNKHNYTIRNTSFYDMCL